MLSRIVFFICLVILSKNLYPQSVYNIQFQDNFLRKNEKLIEIMYTCDTNTLKKIHISGGGIDSAWYLSDFYTLGLRTNVSFYCIRINKVSIGENKNINLFRKGKWYYCGYTCPDGAVETTIIFVQRFRPRFFGLLGLRGCLPRSPKKQNKHS